MRLIETLAKSEGLVEALAILAAALFCAILYLLASCAVWKSNFRRHQQRDVVSIAAPARWRGDSAIDATSSPTPRAYVGSMAWRFTKVHAITQLTG